MNVDGPVAGTFDLVMLTAIGLGMMYMSDTETSVNSNYRDTQLSFLPCGRGSRRCATG